MAQSYIQKNPSIVKVLTVTADQSRPASVTSADITAYQVGYLVYVVYTITAADVIDTYKPVSIISGVRPRGGASQPQSANVLASATLGVLKTRMSASGSDCSFQMIVSRAGTYAGSFVYVTDATP
jgi:hypothetical protein